MPKQARCTEFYNDRFRKGPRQASASSIFRKSSFCAHKENHKWPFGLQSTASDASVGPS